MKSHLPHLVFALLVAATALFGYGCWYAVVAAESAAVASVQDQIVAKTETVSRIASARVALAEIAGDEDAVQGYFVPETGVVAFIEGLEAQGRAQGAVVSVLSVSTGSAGTQPTFILALAIKGTFDTVMRTVGSIEYDSYDLSISNMSLAQDDKNSWHAGLNLIVGSVGTATSTP